MKKRMKRSLLLIVFTLMLSVVFMPMQTEAAAKKYMKKQNVKWDIKKGKTVTLKNYYAGVGMVNEKAKVTQYKVSKSIYPGYKKVTMTVKFMRGWKPSVTQIDQMVLNEYCRSTGKIGGASFVHLVDYKTGKSLWHDSRFRISTDWTSLTAQKKTYWGNLGYVWFTPEICKIEVDYPANYKGLCIGFSGITSVNKAKDTKYEYRKLPIGKARFISKKYKTAAHFKRVTK